MKTIKTFLGTVLGFAMVVTFTMGVSALVLSLAAEQFPEVTSIKATLRCIAGVPDDDSQCVSDLVATLRLEREAIERERQQLSDDIAKQNFVFVEGEKLRDSVSLVVGTLYQDASQQTGLIRSFCWVIVDSGGLDPRVGIAIKHSDGRVEDVALDRADLALLQLNAQDVDAARAACPFPDHS